MFIVKHKNFFVGLSLLLVVLSLTATFGWGLKEGIDFKGGSILEVAYPGGSRPDVVAIKEKITPLNLGEVTIQPSGNTNIVLRMRDLKESERVQLLGILSSLVQVVPQTGSSTPLAAGQLEQKRFNSIGPVIGSELRQKSWMAIATVIILIVLFIAFAFRKVSAPVASWKYGLSAVIALIHDVILPTGFVALLGHFYGVEVDILFVTALLAILGFSVHDTIVVFDRIRENLKKHVAKTFEETVGVSLQQTFSRSINTSLTVVLVLVVLYFFGGESTKNFALILAVGVICGTYSSIFLASPLVLFIEKWQAR